MIRVDINQISCTRDSLQIGCVVRFGDDGPVRFVRTYLEDDVLDWATLGELTEYLNRQVSRHLDREREIAEDQALPGL